MKVVIAGCGRVGAQLATSLSTHDHDVSIIDKNPAAFRRLGRRFAGQTVAGIVFDRDVLEQAGIRQAQALVAVTSGDNSNIVAARVAREHYGVERVVARIYDPERAAIYERLGIHTLASAQWTAEAAMRLLLPQSSAEVSVSVGTGDVALISYPLPADAEGLTAADISSLSDVVVAAVTSGETTRVPPPQAVLSPGDILHLSVPRGSADRIRAVVDELVRRAGERASFGGRQRRSGRA